MINLKVPIIATAITGTLGTFVGIAYSKSKNTTLKDEFFSKGQQILEFNGTADDEKFWKKLAEKYKETLNTVPKIDKIVGLELKGTNDISELKSKCKEIVNKPLKDSNIERYKKEAENWCIKEPKALTT